MEASPATFRLVVHPRSFSEEELIVNADAFPGGGIYRVYADGGAAADGVLLQVRPPSEADRKRIAQFSVLDSVADLFGLNARSLVRIERVEAASVRLEAITITFKDQYLGSADMRRVSTQFIGRCVYRSEVLRLGTANAAIGQMYAEGQAQVRCGLICESTNIIYRSRSAQVYLLIQLSREMWQFTTAGDMCYEKAVSGVLPSLLARWEAVSANHNVTVMLFSRTLYDDEAAAEAHAEWLGGVGCAGPAVTSMLVEAAATGSASQPRRYRDHYMVVAERVQRGDWQSMLVSLKLQLGLYPATVGCDGLQGVRNSSALQGNLFEAVHLSLNVLDRRHEPRDLLATGETIVAVTAGSAVIQASNELSTRRSCHIALPARHLRPCC